MRGYARLESIWVGHSHRCTHFRVRQDLSTKSNRSGNKFQLIYSLEGQHFSTCANQVRYRPCERCFEIQRGIDTF